MNCPVPAFETVDDIRYRRDRGTTPRPEDVSFLLAEHDRLLEAIASALTSLDTGPMRDGYAYSVLSDAVGER